MFYMCSLLFGCCSWWPPFATLKLELLELGLGRRKMKKVQLVCESMRQYGSKAYCGVTVMCKLCSLIKQRQWQRTQTHSQLTTIGFGLGHCIITSLPYLMCWRHGGEWLMHKAAYIQTRLHIYIQVGPYLHTRLQCPYRGTDKEAKARIKLYTYIRYIIWIWLWYYVQIYTVFYQ